MPSRAEVDSRSIRGNRVHAEAVERVAERVRTLASSYEPPSFEHVPEPDSALFLSAIDHRTGYRAGHSVGGQGPLEGSELMWAVGLRAAEREPGLLTAASLREITGERVAELFRIDDETVAEPERRAALWRDLAVGLQRDHGGRADALLAAARGRLGGDGGLLALLAPYEAYGDPLRKKSFLFVKICERRGWLEVRDPDGWEVCADNVLMRLALRSGLVGPGSLAEVRESTVEGFAAVARRAGISPPILDDLLWELGRDDSDLLGTEGGDLSEPRRDPSSDWY
ncbi:MAG: hypothetical protein ACRDMH_16705 [Solirubrobacterales bacterium]